MFDATTKGRTAPTLSIWIHPLDDPEYQALQRIDSWGPPHDPPPPPPQHSSSLDCTGNSGYHPQPSPSLPPPVPYASSPAPQDQSNAFGNPAAGGDNTKGLGAFAGGAAAGGSLVKLKAKYEEKMGAQGSQRQQYQHQQQQPQQQEYASQHMYGQPHQQYGQPQQPMYPQPQQGFQ
ncbi:hypothetical protein Rt10032_c26g6801 [Rhodotorula toruloides]|uniref:Uncharacterized protein n=1 Tax=Rhodotorula toruloides TaxID=5286 RepID=A0A511KTB2_RHOTO|nr:hypothetical protein Rt10032_c26g6801 [Rhodotorula toruloides]